MEWPFYHARDLIAPGFDALAGYSQKYSNHEWGPSGRDLKKHGFLLLIVGEGTYWDSEHRHISVQAGDLFFLYPGLRHNYAPHPDSIWHEAFLDVHGDLCPLLERQGVLNRKCPVVRPPPDSLRPLRSLIDDIADASLTKPLEAQWRLHTALHHLSASLPHSNEDTSVDQTRRLLEDTPPDQAIDPERIAQEVGIGYETLRKRFKTITGLAMHAYRLRVRCQHAATLLANTQQSLEDIAIACGFCDTAHLTRHFRKHQGISPGAFRKLHRQ